MFLFVFWLSCSFSLCLTHILEEPSEEEIALSIFPPVADQIGSGVAFEKSTDVPAEGEKRGYNESRSSSSSSDSGSSSSDSDSDRSHMDPMQGIHRSLKTIKIKVVRWVFSLSWRG